MRNIGLPLATSLMLAACTSGVVFQADTSIPGGSWDASVTPEFTFEIADTVSKHDVYIDVRHTGDYAYSDLYLFIDLEGPGGRNMRDTVECLLADPMGHWLGKGTGFIFASRTHDAKVLYRLGNRFPVAGRYTIRIEQGMRDNPLPGIIDVGVSIERSAAP
ncbi:MAG: gliding motility lipoprotein GldH [Flavobacteriales bacterium]|nr:gliding motility lipoprotein GldH [Flavobacteriales bacterium]